MEHPLQAFLRERNNTLSDLKAEPYELSISASDDLVSFKYNQIKSDMNLPICLQSRGVLLERGSWDIVAYPFDKFFNLQESKAAAIDWDSAVVYEKLDGTCAVLYFHDGEWKMKTLGTVEGEGPIHAQHIDLPEGVETFNDLFWYTWDEVYPDLDPHNELHPHYTFIFELCTPYNQVVKYYEEPRIVLLGVRHNHTFEEYCPSYHDDVLDVPKMYDIKQTSPSKLKAMVDLLPYDEEGYVVRDDQFRRIKLKNPSYVSAHKTKDTISRKSGILDLIFDDEVDDFLSVFPEHEEKVNEVIENLKALERSINAYYIHVLDGPNVDPDDHEERKSFALEVRKFSISSVSSVFFQLLTGKCDSIHEALSNLKRDYVLKALDQLDKQR